jgi:hypothetical protein
MGAEPAGACTSLGRGRKLGGRYVPTIHVATVHWRSDRWIDVQLRYVDRYLGGRCRVYAFLNDITGDHGDKFFYSSREPIKDHATKLNLLCDVICSRAEDPSDVLVVMDSDAFPIAPIEPLLEERLDYHRLIAVQRSEHYGERQPHPCFCVTTVGFWTAIGGDWRKGYEYRDGHGLVSAHPGGRLLDPLEREGVDWYPLRRVNRVALHPLFFGLYGDRQYGPLVYHHGAGSRTGPGRVSRELAGEQHLTDERAVKQLRRRLRKAKEELNDQVFERIQRDAEFWREFA